MLELHTLAAEPYHKRKRLALDKEVKRIRGSGPLAAAGAAEVCEAAAVGDARHRVVLVAWPCTATRRARTFPDKLEDLTWNSSPPFRDPFDGKPGDLMAACRHSIGPT
jgi:hypothetical protein